MKKTQLMAGTLAALTVASAITPAAMAAQPEDSTIPYSAGYSGGSVVACVLTKKMQGSEEKCQM